MEKRSWSLAVIVTRMLPQRQLPVMLEARLAGSCCLGSPVKGGMVERVGFWGLGWRVDGWMDSVGVML